MSRRVSLSNQMQHAVHMADSFGHSRHRDKNNDDSDNAWRVYSIRQKSQIIDVVKDIAKFVVERYPDTRRVVDIKSYMLQAWLDEKADGGKCRQSTVNQYMSLLHKIDNICRHAYGANMCTNRIVRPEAAAGSEKVKVCVMDEKRYTMLVEQLQRNTDAIGRAKPVTQVWKSAVLSHACGLRVEETALVHRECIKFDGGRYGYGTVTLRDGDIDGAKHGRGRTVHILDADDRAAIQKCCDGVKMGQTVVQQSSGRPYKAASITRRLSDAMNDINAAAAASGKPAVFGAEWYDNKSHPIRKQYAQRCYDTVRGETMYTETQYDSKVAARSFTNEQLGHGDDRDDQITTYVANKW